MRLTRLLIAVLGATVVGCPSEETCAPFVATSDVECTTTKDCIDEGFNTLTCVSGLCRRACLRDDDCVIDIGETGDECRSANDPQPQTPICEAQVCETGCPSVPCGAGETCVGGRCAYDFEGFEIPDGQTFVDLQSIGFTLDVELQNPATRIAQIGRADCALGDELCAGVARTGDRFVSVRRAPTPPKGVADTSFTCRDCACCLDCLLNPPPTGENAVIPFCPGAPGRLWFLPQALSCPATPPAECQAACTACDACPAATPAPIGDGLATCEADAAGRGCAKCQQCDAFVETCRTSQCGAACAEPGSAQCSTCVQTMCLNNADCADCRVCSDAADCELAMEGTAECAMKRATCDALGTAGCYPTPSNYSRAQLTDEEQALTSRPIDLSSASGSVILQMDYVPFNVGATYKVGQQGVDPALWETAPQELLIQLCGGDCTNPASWTTAMTPSGEVASIPPTARQSNGLTLGSQSEIDWQSGRFIVTIPEALRTSTFRYRLLPRLDEDARIGVDDIFVRRVQ